MANVNTQVTATGSYKIGIDSDNDSTTQTFEVLTNTSGTPVLLIQTQETGGTYFLGKGNFSTGGVRTRSQSGAPSGGQDGDLVVDTTNLRLYVKVSGTWRFASLA